MLGMRELKRSQVVETIVNHYLATGIIYPHEVNDLVSKLFDYEDKELIQTLMDAQQARELIAA